MYSSSYSINSAYKIFRGINKADNSGYYTKDDSELCRIASEAAKEQDNKTAITVALEDFTEKIRSFHGEYSTNITAKDAKEGFFSKKTDNIFASKDGQKFLKNKGKLFQNDIFRNEQNKYHGINYADEENIAQSALNFAKADINAIETAYCLANPDCIKKGALDSARINSYIDTTRFSVEEALKNLDLDGNTKTLSAREYASYMIAVDGLIKDAEHQNQVHFSSYAVDGIVSDDEAELAYNFSDKYLQLEAKNIYDKYYSSNSNSGWVEKEKSHPFLDWLKSIFG